MQLFIDVLLSKLERNTKKEIETLSFKRSFCFKNSKCFFFIIARTRRLLYLDFYSILTALLQLKNQKLIAEPTENFEHVFA